MPATKPQPKKRAKCRDCSALRKQVAKLKAEKIALDRENDELYDVVQSAVEFLTTTVAYMEKRGLA